MWLFFTTALALTAVVRAVPFDHSPWSHSRVEELLESVVDSYKHSIEHSQTSSEASTIRTSETPQPTEVIVTIATTDLTRGDQDHFKVPNPAVTTLSVSTTSDQTVTHARTLSWGTLINMHAPTGFETVTIPNAFGRRQCRKGAEQCSTEPPHGWLVWRVKSDATSFGATPATATDSTSAEATGTVAVSVTKNPVLRRQFSNTTAETLEIPLENILETTPEQTMAMYAFTHIPNWGRFGNLFNRRPVETARPYNVQEVYKVEVLEISREERRFHRHMHHRHQHNNNSSVILPRCDSCEKGQHHHYQILNDPDLASRLNAMHDHRKRDTDATAATSTWDNDGFKPVIYTQSRQGNMFESWAYPPTTLYQKYRTGEPPQAQHTDTTVAPSPQKPMVVSELTDILAALSQHRPIIIPDQPTDAPVTSSQPTDLPARVNQFAGILASISRQKDALVAPSQQTDTPMTSRDPRDTITAMIQNPDIPVTYDRLRETLEAFFKNTNTPMTPSQLQNVADPTTDHNNITASEDIFEFCAWNSFCRLTKLFKLHETMGSKSSSPIPIGDKATIPKGGQKRVAHDSPVSVIERAEPVLNPKETNGLRRTFTQCKIGVWCKKSWYHAFYVWN